jgi:hypothetical protein
VSKIVKTVKDTAATLVAVGSNGIGTTFTIGHNDAGQTVFVGAFGPLGKRIALGLISGSVEVMTPHKAFGAYGERGAGGIGAVKNAAKSMPLIDQLVSDPRFSAEDGAVWFSELEATYGTFRQN